MSTALWALVAVNIILAALVVALVWIVAKSVDHTGRDRLVRAVLAKNGLEYDLLTRSAALEKVSEQPAKPHEPREPRPMPHGADGSL